MTDTASAYEALIQYLQTDRILGLRDIPLASRPRRAAAQPGPRGAVAAPARPAVPPEDLADRVERLRVLDEQRVRPCVKCGLAQTRSRTVFGQGNPAARLVFVGEAPGYEEDKQGLAFVGPAGQLLTRMIAAMGLTRDDVYICNIIKCRPPENRTPATDELAACSPYLYEQLAVIRPEVIVALGAPAAKTLLQTGDSIGRLRGRFHDFQLPRVAGPPGCPTPPGWGTDAPIPLMPTYHPAYLLRTPSDKTKAWADLQQVMQRLGLPLPQR